MFGLKVDGFYGTFIFKANTQNIFQKVHQNAAILKLCNRFRPTNLTNIFANFVNLQISVW